MFNLLAFLAGFILGGLILFSRRESSCWPCSRARHCAQLPPLDIEETEHE